MDYAIIRLGNKQHRVRDGETLVVDRLPGEPGSSFSPDVLLGEGAVTATVVAHERGPKIVIGKYRRRTGYKRHTGFRAATSRVEISFGSGRTRRARPAAEVAPAAAQPEAAPTPAAAPADAAPTSPEVSEGQGGAATGLPSGYTEMTVAQVHAQAKSWSAEEVEAALAYEQAHAARKGALAALESARKGQEEER